MVDDRKRDLAGKMYSMFADLFCEAPDGDSGAVMCFGTYGEDIGTGLIEPEGGGKPSAAAKICKYANGF